MSELVEFIRGCLDADEQTAREAMTVVGDDMTTYSIAEWWEKPEHARVYAGHWHPVVQAGQTHGDPVFYNSAALPHVARHDPARVLEEVNAKREFLGLLIADVQDPRNAVRAHWASEILLMMADAYRGEPGWRDEWGTQ